MRQRSALALPMPAAYFRLLLRRYGGSPTAAAALVADTDVDPEHLAASGEITLGQQLTQFRNLAAREAPGWGLDAGSGFEASTHGPLGFACASAPTLGAALDVLARFAHVRSPFYRVVPAEGSAKSFRLHVEESLPLDEAVRVPLLEMVMLSSQALVELVLGRPAREARFDFAYPAPETSLDAEGDIDAFGQAAHLECAHDAGVEHDLVVLHAACIEFRLRSRAIRGVETVLDAVGHFIGAIDQAHVRIPAA
jgi:hypothetical protein